MARSDMTMPGRNPKDAEARRSRLTKATAFFTPLILTAIAGLLILQVGAANSLRDEEAAAQEQRALILSVLSAHQDIETGSRGYIITGQESFLEPLTQGVAQLARISPELRRAYVDSPQESAALDRMAAISRQKRAFVQKTVALRRAGAKDRAEALVARGDGKRLMDEIREEIQLLLTLENATLQRVTADSHSATVLLRTVTFGLLGLLLLLLAMAWLALRRTIASRDHALVELRDVSQRRQAILEGAMDGIITINPSGSIESANPAIERIFGYSAAELNRRDVGMLLANQQPIGKAAENLHEMSFAEHRSDVVQEVEMRRKDGTVFPAEVAISAVHLTEGRRYVAVIRDVAERKRIERLKAEFVSTVSHELRTPLTSISGSLGLLAAHVEGTLDARSARLVEIARGNANRLVRLINDILDIEKMESGRMRFDSRELDLKVELANAQEAIHGYAQEYGVTVVLQAPHEGALVLADRDRLAQVFDNLLSNAVKFSPHGATVHVELVPRSPSHEIRITDEGEGIPAEFQDRIFGKFAQADGSDSRQKGGTGLGLNIVREIMRRLGGHVDFTTQAGVGTTFRLTLPAHEPAAAAAKREKPMILACGEGAATAFTAALCAAGYEVHMVQTMQDLTALIDRTTYDAAVVDMGMSQGAGIAMIRAIRESRTNAVTPLLALGGTSGTSEFDGDATLVLDWLHKPSEVERLVDRIDATAGLRSGKMPLVLHVEDDPDVLALVAAALEGHAQVVAASSVANARAELARNSFDLAVVDLTLSDGSGIALLPELRMSGPSPMPVVVFSAQDADPTTAGLVDAYLTKSRTPISSLVAIVGSLTDKRPSMDVPA
jgi:PAS domain S-box-containing protein